jgi:DNA invertase Pin-like site-specific DNA recombinase
LRYNGRGRYTTVRAAIYARVSTADQHAEIQVEQLRAYAGARGFEVVAEYVDGSVSGAQRRRVALDSLMASARRREVDLVACTKLDRLGRSLHHLLEVLGELEALGVEFVSTDDGIDTSTPTGRLFLQIRGAFAEYERALIRERTMAGLIAARKRGRRLGRPRALGRTDRERVARLRRSGHSIRAIAAVLGTSASTIHRQVVEQHL